MQTLIFAVLISIVVLAVAVTMDGLSCNVFAVMLAVIFGLTWETIARTRL